MQNIMHSSCSIFENLCTKPFQGLVFLCIAIIFCM